MRALVVGCGGYKGDMGLKNPTKDAEAVAASLLEAGAEARSCPCDARTMPVRFPYTSRTICGRIAPGGWCRGAFVFEHSRS